MKRFLSFTTALVSIAMLNGADSFAVEATKATNGTGYHAAEKKNVDYMGSKHTAKKMSRKKSGSRSKVATKKTTTPAPIVHANAHTSDATEGPTCIKDATFPRIDDGRPKIFLGGVIDAYYHYASQGDGYAVGSAYNNIGVKGMDATPGYINGQATHAAGTNLALHQADNYTPASYGDYSRSWGAEADASLQFKIQGQNKTTGIIYGAVADMSLNGVGSSSGGTTPFHTNGTYLYGSSSYGTVSLGYQDGPETEMRIDASNISVADMGLGSDWYKYANIEGKDGTVPFLLASGLYTESFLEGTNTSGQFVNRVNKKLGYDAVDAAMPFRFSYTSPLFAGFKFGVSYAPRYNAKGFTNAYNKDFVSLGTGIKYNTSVTANVPFHHGYLDSSLTPFYKNIISGGVSYQYGSANSMNFAVAAVGEMGSAVKHDDEIVKGNLYDNFVEGRDLRAFGIGAKLGYAGIDFVASFGNHSSSGSIEHLYAAYSSASGSASNDITMVDATTSIPKSMQLYKKDGSTTYFSVGAGYRYSDAYISATFFRSKAYDQNELRHFAVGAQYNLSYGRTVFAPYVSWNYFWTEQQGSLVNDGIVAGSNVVQDDQLNGFIPHPADNKGSVLLAGVRFLFS